MDPAVTLRALHAAAKKARYEQKEYFAGDRTPARLQQSKAAEKVLDRMLAEIETKGLLG